MKLSIFALALVCSSLYTAQAAPGWDEAPTEESMPSLYRSRREPQGSVRLDVEKPLSGPNRNPSIDLSYNQRLINNGRTTLDAYGGANYRDRHVSPQAGLNYEHRFKNDIFLSGQGQVREGPRGRLEPSFGAGIGWRFRREVMPAEEEQEEEELVEELA
ncbi:hymenoptaecin-like [Venturia canescens]|uniref:hymenoptaecin-like n=1 Tax=Venturia canescens TaxID=32260 RepID=UPI001C9CF871|nr:hymenoptaecin-like [Venturia canescens]